MSRRLSILAAVSLLLGWGGAALGDVTVASLFSDHAVLQRDIAIFAYQTAVDEKFISDRPNSGNVGQVAIGGVQCMGEQVASGRSGYVPVTLEAIEVGIQIVNP